MISQNSWQSFATTLNLKRRNRSERQPATRYRLIGTPAACELHRVEAQADAMALVARAGPGSPRSSTIALPSPETPASSLTTTWAEPGLAARSTRDRRRRVGAAGDLLDAQRVRTPRALEQLARAALGAEVGERGVGAVDGDAEGVADACSSSVET